LRKRQNLIEKKVREKFKDHSLRFNFKDYDLDSTKITKAIKKLLKINENSKEEISEIVNMIEDGNEIDISSLEDIKVQKYLNKLLKHLKFIEKKPLVYIKSQESKFSSYFIVDTIFDYLKQENEEKIQNKETNNLNLEENDVPVINEKPNKKDFDYKKEAIDYEYQILQDKLGNNQKFLNKTFSKIMNEKGNTKKG